MIFGLLVRLLVACCLCRSTEVKIVLVPEEWSFLSYR